MKLVALFVANNEEALRYRKMLADQSIRVPVYVVSEQDESPLAVKLPALYTKHNIYEGETEVAQALVSYKESSS